MEYKEITRCRSCKSYKLVRVLDLGQLPISDFPDSPDKITKAPLEVVQCKSCSLVQLLHTVDRNLIYSGDYWYRSGTNESMVQNLKDIVEYVQEFVDLEPDDYVLDIGSNDGTLLSFYPRHIWCHGFEPSHLLGIMGVRKAHARIFLAYFPPRWWINTRYKAITSIAQMYNVENLDTYVKVVKEILHPDGVWCIQMAYLPNTLATNNIGDFCHEHLSFWTLTSLEHLLRRYELQIVDISYNKVNGGSFRVVVKHGVRDEQIEDTALELDRFVDRVGKLKTETVDLLQGLKVRGYKVIGLGASTKNNTVLSYYNIGPKLIPYFADRQPEKVGRYTVTGIPIMSEEEARERKPDYFFIGPFHFLDSLIKREQDFLSNGGKFIVPFPELRVIGGT